MYSVPLRHQTVLFSRSSRKLDRTFRFRYVVGSLYVRESILKSCFSPINKNLNQITFILLQYTIAQFLGVLPQQPYSSNNTR